MKRGIACLCLSAFGFSLMAVCVRLADVVGPPIPAMEKALFRNLVAAVIALFFFLREQRVRPIRVGGLRRRDWLDLILRSVFGTVGIFANFYAISHIPLGDSMALNKTAPFFTLLACWALVGEKMCMRQMLCLVGAFAGALFVIQPGFGSGFGQASWIGLASGVTAGIAYALLHRLGRSGVNASFIILFFSVFSCLACVPFCVCCGMRVSAVQFLTLMGAGASAALGQFGITWAYRFTEPRKIALYDYSGLFFSAALGYLVFGQIPNAWSLLGFGLIVAMAVVLSRNPLGIEKRCQPCLRRSS